jgi:hypothetical protein
MTKKPAKSKTNGKPAAAKTPPPAPTTRTPTEQTLRELQKAIEGKSFTNPAEASAFLQTLLGSGAMESLLDDVPLSLKDEAQELAFDAMEADNDAQAMQLAKRALRKDPDCVDALVVLAEIESDSPKKLIASLQKAVAPVSGRWARSSSRRIRAISGASLKLAHTCAPWRNLPVCFEPKASTWTLSAITKTCSLSIRTTTRAYATRCSACI